MESYRCHVCGYEAESGADLEEHLTCPFVPSGAARIQLGMPPSDGRPCCSLPLSA